MNCDSRRCSGTGHRFRLSLLLAAPMTVRIEKHIEVKNAEHTAIGLLAEHTALSKSQLKAAMSNGAVWLESQHGIRRIRRAKKALKPGDTLHLYYDSLVQAQAPETAVLVADEGSYSIWNKPYGMYSQGSKWGDHCTIYRWAEQHMKPQRPAYPVHRLDRAANGLIILAHNRKTARAFLQMFRQRAITKHYRAVVEGDLGDLKLPRVIDLELDGKASESVILEAEYSPDENTTTALIDIRTGRKHQIRRHMASIGHPVVGDRLYGAGDTRKNLQLSSIYLSFDCPVENRRRSYSLEESRNGS